MPRRGRYVPPELDLDLVRWALDVARGTAHRHVAAEAMNLARRMSAEVTRLRAENARLRHELSLHGYEADA